MTVRSDMSVQQPRVLALWSWPRATSTMFSRCWIQRDDFTVLHEPFDPAFYWSKERMSPRFSDAECNAKYSQYRDETFEKAWDKVVQSYEDADGRPLRVFMKDIAKIIIVPKNHAPTAPTSQKSLDGNPTVIPSDRLLHPDIQHCFLIRHPAKSILSWYKLSKSAEDFAGDVNPEELGFEPMKDLYNFICQQSPKTTPSPIVLDSDDLLRSPEVMLRHFCQRANVEFDEKMLTWQSRPDMYADFPGAFDRAAQSTGIESASSAMPDTTDWSPEMKALLEQALPIYEELSMDKLKADG